MSSPEPVAAAPELAATLDSGAAGLAVPLSAAQRDTLLARLAENRFPDGRIELVIVGNTGDEVIQRWEREMQQQSGEGEVRIIWHGVAQEGRIPEIDRSAHLLYAADIQAACPNSVIEAMACGLPVVAFDTGALPELVTPQAGRLVPYGADSWKLEQPDFYGLAQAAGKILQERERYSQGARQRAKAAFDLERMVDAYLVILLDS